VTWAGGGAEGGASREPRLRHRAEPAPCASGCARTGCVLSGRRRARRGCRAVRPVASALPAQLACAPAEGAVSCGLAGTEEGARTRAPPGGGRVIPGRSRSGSCAAEGRVEDPTGPCRAACLSSGVSGLGNAVFPALRPVAPCLLSAKAALAELYWLEKGDGNLVLLSWTLSTLIPAVAYMEEGEETFRDP
jgi:hypothetical protein